MFDLSWIALAILTSLAIFSLTNTGYTLLTRLREACEGHQSHDAQTDKELAVLWQTFNSISHSLLDYENKDVAKKSQKLKAQLAKYPRNASWRLLWSLCEYEIAVSRELERLKGEVKKAESERDPFLIRGRTYQSASTPPPERTNEADSVQTQLRQDIHILRLRQLDLEAQICLLKGSATKSQTRFCYSLIVVTLLLVSASLTLSMWWSIAHADVSGGFTMGAYVVAVAGMPLAIAAYGHRPNCHCWERELREAPLVALDDMLQSVETESHETQVDEGERQQDG